MFIRLVGLFTTVHQMKRGFFDDMVDTLIIGNFDAVENIIKKGAENVKKRKGFLNQLIFVKYH